MPLGRFLALALMLGTPALMAATLHSVEPMPTVNAAALASRAILDGDGYTVDASVPVVGYMGQFTLRSGGNTFVADGVDMLKIRVTELSSIAQLNQLTNSGVFVEALANSAKNAGAAIGQAVRDPVNTVAGIPAGVGRFFQSANTKISRATEPKNAQGAGTGEAAKDLLGMSGARRRIARQVGADPYTTNPVLAKQLDDLARAAFMGGVSLDAAFAVATGGVATAISTTARISNLVWEKSPEDIRALNEQKLTSIGVDGATVRAFVTNRWFTPTLSVAFVDYLGELYVTHGRAAVVALASTVASEGEARYMVNVIRLARQAGSEKDPIVALDLSGRILTARTRSGRLVVPAPVDYLAWTAPVSTFAVRKSLGATRRDLLLTGVASPSATEGLHDAGWTVSEHSK